MHFFNIDLHVAVIADVRRILEGLGHRVTSWGISGHEWVFGRHPARVDVINQATWRGLDQRLCDAFYARYARELDGYDAFVVTHTPSFAMLYERWEKPIIVVASTRYECPFTSDRARWEGLNAFLRRHIDDGLVIPVANNKYDAAYAEYFTGRPWPVIPSLCEYTGARYTGTRPQFLHTSLFKGFELPPGVVDRDRAFAPSLIARALWRVPGVLRRGPSWQDFADHRGVIHVPYNASIMQLFELYSAGVPLFMPSFQFLGALHRRHAREGVLSQLSYNQVEGRPPGSAIPADARDPNNYVDTDLVMEWTRLADFYDPENMPHIVQFDSFDHLRELLEITPLAAVSERMRAHQATRRAAAISSWRKAIERLR
jgi:hypothetical protein